MSDRVEREASWTYLGLAEELMGRAGDILTSLLNSQLGTSSQLVETHTSIQK